MATVYLAQKWRVDPTQPTAQDLPTLVPRGGRCQGFGPPVVWKPKPWLRWDMVRSVACPEWPLKKENGHYSGQATLLTMSLACLNFSLLNIFGCDYKSIHLL